MRSSSRTNSSDRDREHAGTGTVSQTQSSPSGGISANVNQFSHGPRPPTQHKREQCEDAAASGLTACSTAQDPPAYSLTQVQYGPVKNAGSKSPTAASRSLAVVRKDPGSIQSGNSGNTFTINQTSTQHNDAGQNQTNVVQGACSTSGDCTVTQNTNGTTNVQSGSDVNTRPPAPEAPARPPAAPPAASRSRLPRSQRRMSMSVSSGSAA